MDVEDGVRESNQRLLLSSNDRQGASGKRLVLRWDSCMLEPTGITRILDSFRLEFRTRGLDLGRV